MNLVHFCPAATIVIFFRRHWTRCYLLKTVCYSLQQVWYPLRILNMLFLFLIHLQFICRFSGNTKMDLTWSKINCVMLHHILWTAGMWVITKCPVHDGITRCSIETYFWRKKQTISWSFCVTHWSDRRDLVLSVYGDHLLTKLVAIRETKSWQTKTMPAKRCDVMYQRDIPHRSTRPLQCDENMCYKNENKILKDIIVLLLDCMYAYACMYACMNVWMHECVDA